MMALRMKVVWCHLLLLMIWTSSTWLTDAAEATSSGFHEEEKRSPHMYSFGLGKKSAASVSSDGPNPAEAESSFEDDGLFNSEDEEYFDPRNIREPSRYTFGLGKRDQPSRFAFGLGKRPDRGGRFAFGLGKRPEAANRFAFGLGKRPEAGNRFAFGLGKRPEAENRLAFGLGKRPDSLNRFAFGIGKRSETGHRFAFGLGKRDSVEDSDEAIKRFIPDIEDYMKRRYSFGLGKRNNRYAFGLGRKKRESDSDTASSKPMDSEST